MEVGPKVIIRAPDKSIAQRSRKLLPSLHDSGADRSNGCQGSTLSPVSLGARRAVGIACTPPFAPAGPSLQPLDSLSTTS